MDDLADYTRRTADFPGVLEGVRSMRFVEAALESAKTGNGRVRL